MHSYLGFALLLHVQHSIPTVAFLLELVDRLDGYFDQFGTLLQERMIGCLVISTLEEILYTT